MKKIVLSELFTVNNYVAPPFSPEKKAQIFANTTRKKTSLLSIKKKYFVEVALSLVLVFVIGFNLDYIQNIGKPIEIDYQEIIDLELGVPEGEGVSNPSLLLPLTGAREAEQEIGDEGASSDSLAVFGDSVFYDVEETIEVILDVENERNQGIDEKIYIEKSEIEAIEKTMAVEEVVEEKTNLWDKIFRKSSEPEIEKLAYEIVPERYVEEVEEEDVYKPLSSDEDLPLTPLKTGQARENSEDDENIASEIRDEKYFLNNAVDKPLPPVGDLPLSREEVPVIEVVENKTQLLEIIANEVEEPVVESTRTLMLVDNDADLSLSFVENQSISVFENSAKLKFAVRVAGTTLTQSEDINIVCNIYVAGNFVDTFSYTHSVGYNVNKGDTYRFVDTLLSSYALHVLHSYNSDSFSPDVSGIKCGIPKYNIAAGWIDLAYED